VVIVDASGLDAPLSIVPSSLARHLAFQLGQYPSINAAAESSIATITNERITRRTSAHDHHVHPLLRGML
jgi:hypothetical protein